MEWNFTHVVPILGEIPDELRGSEIYATRVESQSVSDLTGGYLAT